MVLIPTNKKTEWDWDPAQFHIMKKIFILPIIAILLILTSCTEENYITEETVVEGAYFNEIRMEEQKTQILEGSTSEVGQLVFDLQGLLLRDIQLDIEIEDGDISDFIESISIEKMNDPNALFLNHLEMDDEDIWGEWEPQAGKELIEGLDTYSIKITTKDNIPNNIQVEFDLDVRIKNLLGNNEYFSNSSINGNISTIFINKN